MTYSAGNTIQASDYNTFATAVLGMNQIFADLYPGVTTLPNAGYGYGQTPALTSVSIGDNVAASEWAALFQTIRKCGTHQDPAYPTGYVPPLPGTDPVIGDIVTAFNTPSTLSSVINTLHTNKFNIAGGQSAQTSGGSSGTTTPWTNTLTYTFTVNLGTWDQARFFFNSGGSIGIYGSYAGGGAPPTSDDKQWYNFLNTVGTIVFRATTTSSLVINQTTYNRGLWSLAVGDPQLNNPLDTTYREVFRRAYGAGGYYTNSYITVEARLTAIAPAAGSGTIQFRVTLTQDDSSPPLDPKIYATTYTMTETHSAVAIPFLSGSGGPGPASVVITPGSFTLG
jgi:hypothetical protein